MATAVFGSVKRGAPRRFYGRIRPKGVVGQSPLRGPRMPRCMVGSRNTQRQTHRRDGDCGLGQYHASSFGSASSLRQIRGVLGTVAAVTPDAERETLYVPVLSDQRRYLMC
jgi:hypothetical protein